MLKSQKTKVSGGESGILEDMFRAGVHYGYLRRRRHPSVSTLIYATKNKSDIINLEKTADMLSFAAEFVKSLGSRGKMILFVGTKPEAKSQIKSAALSLGMPYVSERWIGGTLTNFSEIKRGTLELENYRKDSATGNLEKYTKKERVVMAKKMEKINKYYEGLLPLKRLPDALFIVDAKAEHIALREAEQTGIPTVALVNSDTNIKSLNYPIIGNDASIPSINLFINSLVAAYKEGQMLSPAKEEAKAK